MSRGNRDGKRKSREQRAKYKVPELGYYLIVTDTEATERCFFTGLHDSLDEKIKDRLIIRVVETKTRDMIDKCLEFIAYEAQYRMPWIVFDRDQVKDFDKIIDEAKEKGIDIGWSNPCFEIWMYAYFGIMPVIYESWTCCTEFGMMYVRKTGRKYNKADNKMYDRLCRNGNEQEAIRIAEQKFQQCFREGKKKPSEMCPCTTVYELVREIRQKK